MPEGGVPDAQPSAVDVLCLFGAGALLVGLLALRSDLRRRRGRGLNADLVDAGGSWGRRASGWEHGEEMRDSVKRAIMFFGGVLAGVASAALTHQLDVLKTLRQVGQGAPESLENYFLGICVGSMAQGVRFGVTLLLNSVLQKKLDRWSGKIRSARAGLLGAFVLSMVAAAIGEALANPLVVIKNYQIANHVNIRLAIAELLASGGVGRLFSGLGLGVLRKSIDQALVLQTLGLVKRACVKLVPSLAHRKAVLGFIAGSLTSFFAEVVTNHPDQVKTMMQAGVPFAEALLVATRAPFRGAFFAGLRKGCIRGVNWGCLEVFMGVLEGLYRRYRCMIGSSAHPRRRVSEMTRRTTPV